MENHHTEYIYVRFSAASLFAGAAIIILASCSNDETPVVAMPSPYLAFPRQISSTGEEFANGNQLQPSQFPRQVTSIMFPTGVVGMGQPLTVNAWTITFGMALPTTSPITRYTGFGGGMPVGLMINGLTCRNAITMEHDCSIGFDTNCFVQIPDVVSFGIDCPEKYFVQ